MKPHAFPASLPLTVTCLFWQDDEPDESIFEEQLKDYTEGSEEYDTRKEELMDEWR